MKSFLVAKSAADLESRKKQLEAQINAMSTGPTGRAAGNFYYAILIDNFGLNFVSKNCFYANFELKIEFLLIFELIK